MCFHFLLKEQQLTFSLSSVTLCAVKNSQCLHSTAAACTGASWKLLYLFSKRWNLRWGSCRVKFQISFFLLPFVLLDLLCKGYTIKICLSPFSHPFSSSWLTVLSVSCFLGGLDPLHPWWAATQPPASCGCSSAWHWEWPCPHPQLGWGKHWLGYPYVQAFNSLVWFSGLVGWNFILANIAGRAVSKLCLRQNGLFPFPVWDLELLMM